MRPLTRRRSSAGLAVVLSTGVLAIASHALAANAGTTTVPVTFGAETWYQPSPTCQLPTGCVSVGVTPPAVNPYGAGTLHVSVSAGQETSRSYLNIKATPIPAGLTLTGAVFTAPLDTGNAASLAPDTSTTQVCFSTSAITANEGEFDDPPSDTLCSVDGNAFPLTYQATPTPEVTGDLTPLINAHLSDLSSGKLDLAILPFNAPTTAAWHDVFDSDDGSAVATTPTLTLTFSSEGSAAPVAPDSPSAEPSATEVATPEASASAAPVTSSKPLPVASAVTPVVTTAPVTAGVAPPVGIVPAPVAVVPSAVPMPEVASSEPSASAQAPVSAPVATVASTRTVGFAYPAVLLLPLVLIAGGAGLARVMTRDVTPKSTRTQG